MDFIIKYKSSSFFLPHLLVFCVCYLLSTLFTDAPIVLRLIQMFSLACMGYSFLKNSSFFQGKSRYFMFSLLLLLAWHLYVVLSNYSLSVAFIKAYFVNLYLFWGLFVPIIALFSIEAYYKSMVHWSVIMQKLFWPVLLIFSYLIFTHQDFSEQFLWLFGPCMAFIFLNLKYFPKKNSRRALYILIACLVVATFMARRNIMLTFMAYMFATFSIYVLFSSSLHIVKKIIIFIGVAVLIFGGYVVFIENQDSVFGKITARASANTREELLFWYVDDMEGDWTTGKGLNGYYYAPGIDKLSMINNHDPDDRYMIEGGYLNMILKGGIVNVVLFAMVALPALFIGFFRSRNFFTKASAWFVLLWLIDMFPWGMPALNVGYVLFWMSISVCYTASIRNKTDEEIAELFFTSKQ